MFLSEHNVKQTKMWNMCNVFPSFQAQVGQNKLLRKLYMYKITFKRTSTYLILPIFSNFSMWSGDERVWKYKGENVKKKNLNFFFLLKYRETTFWPFHISYFTVALAKCLTTFRNESFFWLIYAKLLRKIDIFIYFSKSNSQLTLYNDQKTLHHKKMLLNSYLLVQITSQYNITMQRKSYYVVQQFYIKINL